MRQLRKHNPFFKSFHCVKKTLKFKLNHIFEDPLIPHSPKTYWLQNSLIIKWETTQFSNSISYFSDPAQLKSRATFIRKKHNVTQNQFSANAASECNNLFAYKIFVHIHKKEILGKYLHSIGKKSKYCLVSSIFFSQKYC